MLCVCVQLKLEDVPEMGYLHTDRTHGAITEQGEDHTTLHTPLRLPTGMNGMGADSMGALDVQAV